MQKMRRPRLYPATISGVAAQWAHGHLAEKVEIAAARMRAAGRPDVADAFEQTVADLGAATLAYKESLAIEDEAACVSDFGSAEEVVSEMVSGSDQQEVLLTTAAVASLLKISQRRVLQLLGDGSLAGDKSTGRWLIERAEVNRYRVERRFTACE